MSINDTLAARGACYGTFAGHADVTQKLKWALSFGENFESLEAVHLEALEMIAHKMGRIVNGDPNYADSWHDIAGYATLVEQWLASRTSLEAPVTAPAPVPPTGPAPASVGALGRELSYPAAPVEAWCR